jgi:hypothetical protein
MMHLLIKYCYQHILEKLKVLLQFEDLKKGMFQSIKEIGNTIAFVRLLSEVLEITDQFRFMSVAPLLGIGPNRYYDNYNSHSFTIIFFSSHKPLPKYIHSKKAN